MYISKATIDQQRTSMFTEPQLNMRVEEFMTQKLWTQDLIEGLKTFERSSNFKPSSHLHPPPLLPMSV